MRAIRTPSDRSKQRLVGASQLGGCPYHLGLDMAKSLLPPEQVPEVVEEGGQAAWYGTCMHYWIENHISLDGAEFEKKVKLYDLEGYGTIKGHIDLTWRNQVWDWKLLGKWKLDKMKLAYRKDSTTIPDTTYRVQQMCYAYGLVKLGYDITHVNIVAFDKLSNRFEDVTFFTEAYNEGLVLKTFERLELIWAEVRAGRLAELPRDSDCYSCSNEWRIAA